MSTLMDISGIHLLNVRIGIPLRLILMLCQGASADTATVDYSHTGRSGSPVDGRIIHSIYHALGTTLPSIPCLLVLNTPTR